MSALATDTLATFRSLLASEHAEDDDPQGIVAGTVEGAPCTEPEPDLLSPVEERSAFTPAQKYAAAEYRGSVENC